MSVEDRDQGFARIMAELKKLDGAVVKVGIQGDAGSQMLKVAVVQEFGASMTITAKQAYFMARKLMGIDPTAEPGRFWGTVKKLTGRRLVIPERSYLRATYDANLPRLQQAMAMVVDGIESGQFTTAEALGRFAQATEGVFKKRILAGIAPRNAPLTIAQKRGQDTPLIHSGRFVNSLRAVITHGGAHADG